MGLPKPILLRRINEELKQCSEYLRINIPPVPADSDFPLEITITMVNIPAYALDGEEVKHISDHSFLLILSEEYGYRRPEIRWQTPIFHPNIMMPEDGGYVCLRTADTWEFGSKLLSFVKSVEQLVMSPNPKKPFGTETCMKASKFYLDNQSRFEVSVRYRRK